VPSTPAATLRQSPTFVVDETVEEDRRILLANEIESITLLDGRTQALCPATPDAFAIFEYLCLLGKGERPQFLQLEYLPKTFALGAIESVLTNYHQPIHEVCFSPLPIRDLYASNCPQITFMFTAFRALIPITTPPLLRAPQKTLGPLRFPTCSPRHTYRLPLAQAILRAREGGRGHPHSTHQTHH
jgi:hypothetical protein